MKKNELKVLENTVVVLEFTHFCTNQNLLWPESIKGNVLHVHGTSIIDFP